MSLLYHIIDNQKTVSAEIISAIDSLNLSRKPYAAFDLDNTLLIGDIGEAVFASLLGKGLIKDYTWNDYLILLAKNKLRAYKYVIALMQGLKLSLLEDITHEIIKSKYSAIKQDGFIIPIPKPNQQMQLIMEMLREKGIAVYVVTASNEVSARIICKEYFQIPASNIIGAKVACDKKGIIKVASKEFPYGMGKVNLLKKRFKAKPVITAGDSAGDKYLLNYTAKGGIRLWLGKLSFNNI